MIIMFACGGECSFTCVDDVNLEIVNYCLRMYWILRSLLFSSRVATLFPPLHNTGSGTGVVHCQIVWSATGRLSS